MLGFSLFIPYNFPIFEAEVTRVIILSEDEIITIFSYWAKLRSRIYIIVLNNSINSVVNTIQKKIREVLLDK